MSEFLNQLNGPMLYLLLILLAFAAIRQGWFERGKHPGFVKLVKYVVLVFAAVSFIAAVTDYKEYTILYVVGQLILWAVYIVFYAAFWIGGAVKDLVWPYITMWKPK